jgi:hypothetical protein
MQASVRKVVANNSVYYIKLRGKRLPYIYVHVISTQRIQIIQRGGDDKELLTRCKDVSRD